MAQLEKIQLQEEIKSSQEKFYGFYRNNMRKLADLFPDSFLNVVLLEGKDNCVGSVTNWTFNVDGMQMNADVKIDAFDDENKTINLSVFGGDIDKFYNNIRVKREFNKGFVQWTYEVEKVSEDAPSFSKLTDFARKFLIKGVDEYLLKN